MLDIPSTSLFRNIVQVSGILDIKLPPLDPLALLASIQTYVMELKNTPNTPLPKNLCIFIDDVSLLQTMRLASSLVALITQVEELPLSSSPLSMTCAIFLVALEGQSADCIPSHPLLVKELASRVGARKDLVTAHYNAILEVICGWMADVPWLSSSRDPDNLASKGRRKTSHRHVVALGIKEVVRFRIGLLKAKGNKGSSDVPVVCLEVSERADGELSPQIGQKRKREDQPYKQFRSMKLVRPTSKRKPLSQLDVASLSLLSIRHPLALETAAKRPEDSTGLTETILTSSILPRDKQYSRLQLLVNERGGEAFIPDDELFAEGEFDELFRNEDEMNEYRALYGWDKPTPDFEPPSELISPQDWSLADVDIWADLGGSDDKADDAKEKEDVESDIPDEQIIGEWREASPSLELQLDEDDDINFQSD